MRLSRKIILASLATLIVALVSVPAGALAATGSISGTVTGSGGSGPVSGARVCAMSTDLSFADFCATTGATGGYKIENLADDTYRVRFEHSGEYLARWYPAGEKQSEATIVTVAGGADTAGTDIEPPKGGVIEGAITDAASGADLGQIHACAEPTTRGASESECATSASDGSYRIVGIEGGEYRIRLEPELLSGDPDYLSQFYPDAEIASEGTALQVADGATSTGVDAAMHLGGGISGRVVNEAGEPVQGVSVCIYPVLGPESFAFCNGNSAITAADGTYAIRGVYDGEYKVHFYGSRSYLPQFFPGRPTRGAGAAVTVGGTATTTEVDATLHPGGVISGTLSEEGTGDPIPFASICAHRVGIGGEYCGQANAQGDYSILTVPTGEYEVEFAGPDNSTDWPFVTGWYDGVTDRADASHVQVSSGAKTGDIDGVVARGGTISGTVTDTVSGNPATGIYACAYSGGQVVGSCDTTFTDGEYTIIGLPAGSYAVRFSPAAGGVTQNFLVGNKNYLEQFNGDVASETEATPVTVGPGVAETGVDAAMHEGGGISGRITGPLGEPLEGAAACIVTSAAQVGEQCGTTDSAGEYEIPGLYPGAYTVHFPSLGLLTNELSEQYFDGVLNFAEAEPVTVTGTEVTTDIDARLVPGGRIEGTVTDAYDGSPLVGAGVCSEGTSGHGGICVEAEAGGHYSMNLSAGSYRLRFTYGYVEGESEVAEFVTQYFGGVTDQAAATAVTVGSGATVSNIDAALEPTGARLDKVSVATGGDGSGAITSSPAGIDCGSACSDEFETRKTVIFRAEPSAGSTFSGWTGACSGTGPCQIRLTEAADLGATFESSGQSTRETTEETSGTSDEGSSTESTNAPGPGDTAPTVTPNGGPGPVKPHPKPTPKPKRECRQGFRLTKVGKRERCVKVPKKHHKRKPRQ